MIDEKEVKRISDEVDKLEDKLGKPIDPGIKKAVIYLNYLGFCTRMSCEGHTDWGACYPSVSINDPDLSKNQDQWWADVENLEIFKLIDEYNNLRDGNDDYALRLLPVHESDCDYIGYIVIKVGDTWIDPPSDGDPEDVLKKAQEEMDKFTEFMIKKTGELN